MQIFHVIIESDSNIQTRIQSNPHQMQNTQQSRPSTTITTIPDGFVIGTAPNGQQYLVPQFMVPALDQAFAAYHKKLELGVPNEQGGVSVLFNRGQYWIGIGTQSALDQQVTHHLFQSSQSQETPFLELGEGMVLFPPDPVCVASFTLNICCS